jgi:diguanylate cyclase (GGDEF)-like protein
MYNNLDISSLIEFTKSLKVLYVEDNKEAREGVLGLLNNFFNDIIVAVDGEDGLEKYNNNSHIDLIISDIRMPKMNGIEMVSKIREVDDTVSVVMTTAHEETEYLLSCIANNVNGYLLKPINFKQFKKTIKQTCEKIYYMKKNIEYEESLERLVKERTKELEEAKAELLEMIHKDPMTNLYNRRYFNDISETLFALSKREKNHFSALMIDIDRFKLVNDNYGHAIGDKVLEELSLILKNIVRQSDVPIRFGGEEFVILLPNTDVDGAILLAKKIRETVEQKDILLEDNSILKITLSIGVAECDCIHDSNIDNLIHRIDEALYQAKRTGRNRVIVDRKEVV